MIFEKKVEHGTAKSYNYGCRCAKCKKAKSEYRTQTPIKGHGTKWYYDKGCRCDACVDAKMAYRKKISKSKPRKVTTNVEKGTRVCYSCGIEKRLDEFGRNSNNRAFLGRSHECRVCHNKRNRLNKNKPKAKFSIYKSGAKKRNIPFLLSFEEFSLFWNKPCYYCNDQIEGIGLDRKNSDGPYSVKNVVPCCTRCNYAKRNKNEEEFVSMCIKVAEKFKHNIMSPKNEIN